MTQSSEVPSITAARIIVAAPMKSGSTYVSHVLARYFGVRDGILGPTMLDWDAEHNLTPWLFIALRGQSFCFNFHMLPHRTNVVTAQDEGIAIVALWRNIADMIVSFDDYTKQDGVKGPGIFVCDENKYLAMEDHARLAFLIDVIAPWYITFYLRWRSVNVALHPYEQMLLDKRAFFVDVLSDLLTHPPIDELLDASLAGRSQRSDRINVGRVGRGAERLDESLKRRLEERMLEHPDVAQLEILLWELPWEVPALAPVLPLDGSVVRTEADARPFFLSRGRAYPIERPSWLLTRFGERRTPRVIDPAELARYTLSEPLL